MIRYSISGSVRNDDTSLFNDVINALFNGVILKKLIEVLDDRFADLAFARHAQIDV